MLLLLRFFLFSPVDYSAILSILALYRAPSTAAMLSWRVLGNYTQTSQAIRFFVVVPYLWTTVCQG